MKFVIREIALYRDVWVSTSHLRLLKQHLGGQLIKKNSIVITRCFHAASTLITKAGVGFSACWICRLTVARVL
jgi:hypothetical protein